MPDMMRYPAAIANTQFVGQHHPMPCMNCCAIILSVSGGLAIMHTMIPSVLAGSHGKIAHTSRADYVCLCPTAELSGELRTQRHFLFCPSNDIVENTGRPELPQHLCWPFCVLFGTNTVGPVNIRTSASEFWDKQIHQTWARIPKKYLKRANIYRS
jgi:hypothetical protein